MEREKVGEVFKYWGKIGVAGVKVTEGFMQIGDTIQIQGATTNFEQKIDSMQIEKTPVDKAIKGQTVGIKVKDVVRPGDIVYKIKM
jgi:translation initiation factor IF-2